VVLGGLGGLLTMGRSSAVEEPRTTPYHLNKSIGCEGLVLSAVLSSIAEQIQAISVARWNPYLTEKMCPVMSVNTLIHCYKTRHTIKIIASSYIAFLCFVQCIPHGAVHRYWLWSSQLTLAMVYAGERRPCLVCDRCIPVKNTLGWSAVVFCVCMIMQLFCVVFCVVRAVYKFAFSLVINKKKSCSDRLMFSTRSICFTLIVVASVKRLYPRCANQLRSLEKETLSNKGFTP
jgi:lysylphosphatidylglycerol synthetase-like protein (DUF2156 family)